MYISFTNILREMLKSNHWTINCFKNFLFFNDTNITIKDFDMNLDNIAKKVFKTTFFFDKFIQINSVLSILETGKTFCVSFNMHVFFTGIVSFKMHYL